MYNDAAKAYDDLRKRGKAHIQVELEAFPGDVRFSRTPPSCVVCIESVSGAQNEEQTRKVCKTILANMSSEERIIEINVESVVSTLERLRHFFSKDKPKPKKLELVVTVDATEKWKNFYKEEKFSITVSAGSKHILVVSLEPTREYLHGENMIGKAKGSKRTDNGTDT